MNAPPAPLPADAHIAHDLPEVAVPGGHTHYRRERIYYVLTVTPAAGAAGVAVEQTCDRCGAERETGVLNSATGEAVRAGREYATPAGGGPILKARDHHVPDKHVGSRTGLRFPGGTETWKAYRVTWTEHTVAGARVSLGNEAWSEKPAIVTQIPSYILWNDPAPPLPCNLDEAFGVVFQEELVELYAAAPEKPAKPVRGEPVPA